MSRIKANLIKHALLPLHIPDSGDIHLFSYYQPVDQVGGDFYDMFTISEDTIGVCLGDASGHGHAAALVASMCKFLIHTLKRRTSEPVALTRQLNRFLQETLVKGEFLTLTYLFIDVPAHELLFSCAGQFPLMLVRENGTRKLGVSVIDPPLGLFPDFIFHQDSYSMQPGDKLLLLTDGILEAKNDAGEMFGDTHFMKTVRTAAALDGKHFINRLTGHFLDFVGAHEQTDDWTIIVLEREPIPRSPERGDTDCRNN